MKLTRNDSDRTRANQVRQTHVHQTPYPTASQVPALAVNTTVAMKITASMRDIVHAVGIGNGLRSDSSGVDNLCKSWG
jgi:hypothetical protein